MSDLAFPILVMLLVVVAEAAVMQWGQRRPVNWHDVVFNLNSGHIVLWLFRGLEVVCFGFVAKHFSLGLFDAWPTFLMWVFAFLAWDFCFYWLHRLHHRFAVLWSVHVVHHQGEHFNLSLGVRNSWYSSLTSIPFFIVLAVLGLPLEVFVTVSILHYTAQLFNHNALTPNLGVLEKIFVTPTHHRVHHVKDTAYSNTNFGGTFIFWDKLFGTFGARLPQGPFTYGVGGARSSANPFWASNMPVLRFLGWSISPVEQRVVSRFPDLAIVSGALLLFVLVVGYIYQFGYGYSDVSWQQIALFILLAMGSVALGGMSETKAWSATAWLLVSLTLPLLFLGYCGWSQRYWQVPMIAIALHGIWTALTWRAGNFKTATAKERPHG